MERKQYQFYTSCVGCPRNELTALQNMIDDSVDVSRKTFMRHCGESARDVFRQLGYSDHPKQGLTAAGDFHIGYYRSHWNGNCCYFFTWSAIEHVFV